MLTLVVGAAASGKSACAESLVLRSSVWPRVYIATMEPLDSECRARIQRHRTMRADSGFETVECYTGLSAVKVPYGCAALLECMGNLCANELYSPHGSGDGAEEAVLRGIDRLLPQCRELVIVSNEVFSGGSRFEGDTIRYLRLLASINRELAARADQVWEIVCGLPVCHKGGAGDAF